MNKKNIINLIDSILKPTGKYSGNELYYIAQVLDWDNHSENEPFTSRFEKEFAKKVGVKYAIGHNSGTSTLHSCIAAASVGYGDEVIMPAQSVLMNPFSTMHHNGVPVFADLDEETFNINPLDLENKITPRTKAIQVVHMHGLPADMDPIMEIAKKNNLVVIEDTAQCMLGTYKGKIAGTIGDLGSWSFESKKHLSTGEGGMVTTNNEEMGAKVRKNTGLGYKVLTAGAPMRQLLPEEFQDPDYKRHDTLGWNYRLNEITSALGLAQLERIDELVERRQKCAEYFLEAVSDCEFIIPQKVPNDYVNSYYTFTVRYLGDEILGKTWKYFYNEYKKMGGDGFYGGVAVSYQEPALSNKEFFKSGYLDLKYNNLFNFHDGMCPVAERIQRQMMSFKTNYRNLEEAHRQASILNDLIQSI